MKITGRPTVILAKTVKGYGMGKVGEGKNPTHQLKKLDTAAIREFRDRFAIPIPDDDLEEVPYFKPADDSPEMKYLHEHRRALGGYLPQRRRKADEKLAVPALDAFQAVLEPTTEGPRDLDDAGVRAVADAAGARQDDRAARGADHPGRGAHLRHGRHVPAARHLRRAGPAVRAGRQGPGDVLPRGQGGPDPRGRHQRGGRDEFVDRRGDVVLAHEPHLDSLLHLLFDVRVPARSATSRGPRATARRAASCSAPPRAARR